jgi:hypothetical protein
MLKIEIDSRQFFFLLTEQREKEREKMIMNINNTNSE